MGQRVASLEILFEMATGQAISDIVRFGGVVDKTMHGAITAANAADNAMKQMGDLSGAAAGIGRSAADIRREYNSIERSGESMVGQIEREIIAFGKSAAELRNMRVELAAVAAADRGMTELAARLRSTTAALNEMEAASGRLGAVAGHRGSGTLTQLSFQLNDVATMAAIGANPMQIFASQAGQVFQVAQMAEGGVKGFASQVGSLALRFTPLIAATAVAGAALYRWKEELNDGAGLDAYAKQLGLTKKEIEAAGGAAITMGDVMSGVWKTVAEGLGTVFNGKRIIDYLFGPGDLQQLEGFVASIYGAFVGGYRGVIDTWRQFPSALGDLFTQAVNGALGGVGWLINKTIDAINAVGGHLAHVDLGQFQNHFAGSAKAVGSDFVTQIRAATAEATAAMNHFGAQVGKNTIQAARDRLAEAASDHLKKLKKDTEDAGKAQDDLAQLVDSLISKFDPATKAAEQYAKTLQDIAYATKMGGLSSDQAADFAHGALVAFRKTIDDLDDAARIKVTVDYSALDRIAADNPLHREAEAQKKLWDDLTASVDATADHIERAFGRVGGAIGDVSKVLADYGQKQQQIDDAGLDADVRRAKTEKLQLNSLIGLTDAAKGLFKEHSAGYKAMETAEKALTLIQLARTAVAVAEGAANMFAAAGPAGFPLVVAMGAVMAGLGFSGSFGGGHSSLPAANEGTGTVLGDSSAKSESIQHSIDLLADIDQVTMQHSAAMAASLKSIDAHIGGLSALLVRTGAINASADVASGFQTDAIGSVLKATVPLFGSALASLFGTKTSVIGSGLYGGAQSLDSILAGGIDLSTYSDIEKKKKLFGITTGTKTSTAYSGADSDIEQQFGLILKSFYDTIAAAASPLGEATGAVEDRLKGFVVDIGKIDLQGLNGSEIQDKLSAVFGAAADDMARAALPGLDAFQKVGEGYFETLARVATTVEAVTVSLDQLGLSSRSLGIDASMAITGMFDSVSDYQSAANAYFEAFYSESEQAAVKTAQLTNAFAGLGMALPDSIANYRTLVEAQDLTTSAGQSAYAMLLKLAPAFADLQGAGEGAGAGLASAAAIIRQREDLEQKLLEMSGDTLAIRAAELAKIDPTNRALQQRIYDLTDEKDAIDKMAQAAQAAAAAEKGIADERAGLERQWLELTGQTAAIRALDLAKLDASNQALQLMIWARQDEAAAIEKAAQAAQEAADAVAQAAEQEQQRLKAVADERAGLDRQWLELTGDTLALRALDLAKLDETNRARQQEVWALEDQKAATDAAAQAAIDLAAKQQAIADERAGLERQLLELQGDTNAIRAIDLAKIDETNRSRQVEIWRLQDLATATAAATQAAEQAVAAQKAIADERAGLDRQYIELVGDTAAIRASELDKLDISNRARQQEIWALQDQAAATTAATQAAQASAAAQAAIVQEHEGLTKQLLQLQGKTAELRQMELASLNQDNRALQQQIYAIEDAQEAAKAADALRQAWQSVGDTIMDEIKRIRGLDATAGAQGYASLLGQFDAATAGARLGDQALAKSLPTLSKALLDAAADAATSRQELDRIQAMTAGSLEETYGLITGATMASEAATAAMTGGISSGPDAQGWWSAFARGNGSIANDNGGDIAGLRADLKQTKEELVSALAQIASLSARTARALEGATSQTGGSAFMVEVDGVVKTAAA